MDWEIRDKGYRVSRIRTKQIESTQLQTREEITKQIETCQHIQGEIRTIREEFKEDLRKRKQETLDIIKEVQDRSTIKHQDTDKKIAEIQEDLKLIKQKMETLERWPVENIQVKIHPGFLRQDSDLKFYGEKNANPVMFLENLYEKNIEMEMEQDFKKIVRMSMRGAAEHWFDLIEDQCESSEDFENTFLNYYWGDEAQSRVRENLYNGRFDETRGMTREQYAMRKINKARYLEPQMSDGDTRHFTQEIRDVIAIQGIQEVDRILTYLRRVDDIKPCINKQLRYKNNNNIWRDGGRAYGFPGYFYWKNFPLRCDIVQGKTSHRRTNVATTNVATKYGGMVGVPVLTSHRRTSATTISVVVIQGEREKNTKNAPLR